jgi:hypothetical protein
MQAHPPMLIWQYHSQRLWPGHPPLQQLRQLLSTDRHLWGCDDNMYRSGSSSWAVALDGGRRRSERSNGDSVVPSTPYLPSVTHQHPECCILVAFPHVSCYQHLRGPATRMRRNSTRRSLLLSAASQQPFPEERRKGPLSEAPVVRTKYPRSQ